MKQSAKATVATVATPPEPRYTKAAILASKRFERRKDLLTVILKDGKTYTVAEVETAILTYNNKEV